MYIRIHVVELHGGIRENEITVTLEDSNWQKLRIYAIENKTSASAIIDELIAGYLKKSIKVGKRK